MGGAAGTGVAAKPGFTRIGSDIEVLDAEDSKWYPAFVERILEDGSCMATHAKGDYMYTCRHYSWRTRKAEASHYIVDDGELFDEEDEDEDEVHPDSLHTGQKLNVTVAGDIMEDEAVYVEYGYSRMGLLIKTSASDNVTDCQKGDELEVYVTNVQKNLAIFARRPPTIPVETLKKGQRLKGFIRKDHGSLFFVEVGTNFSGIVLKKDAAALQPGDETDFVVAELSEGGKFRLTLAEDEKTKGPGRAQAAADLRVGARIVGNITGEAKDGFDVQLGGAQSGLLRLRASDSVKVGQQVKVIVERIVEEGIELSLDRPLLVVNLTVGQRLNGTVGHTAPGIGSFVDVGCEKFGLVREKFAKNLSRGDRLEFEVNSVSTNGRGEPVFELVYDDCGAVEFKDLRRGDRLRAKVVSAVGSRIFVDIGAKKTVAVFSYALGETPQVGQELPVWVCNDTTNGTVLVLSTMEVTKPNLTLVPGEKVSGKVFQEKKDVYRVDIGTGMPAMLPKTNVEPPVSAADNSSALSIGQEIDAWVLSVRTGKSTYKPKLIMRERVPLDSIEPGQVRRGVVMGKATRSMAVDIGAFIMGEAEGRFRKLKPGDNTTVRVLSVTNSSIRVKLDNYTDADDNGTTNSSIRVKLDNYTDADDNGTSD